jgi:hypothetical protein
MRISMMVFNFLREAQSRQFFNMLPQYIMILNLTISRYYSKAVVSQDDIFLVLVAMHNINM